MVISLEKNKTKNSFSKKNIYKNNISIIQNIYRIKKKYDFIIVSVISPLKKTRLIAKKLLENLILKYL